MNFINRLTYFSGGFIIGLLFLMFFLSGKRTSCSYLPNSRVKKDVLKKNIHFENLKRDEDSILLIKSIYDGNIDFLKSNTKIKDCKEYHFNNKDEKYDIWVLVRNCKNSAIISDYKIINIR